MNNFEFLKKYHELQHGIMYDVILDLDFALIGHSKTDKSVFWNLALVNEMLSKEQIVKIEKTLKSLGRYSTIYFENKEKLGPLKDFLKKEAYRQEFEDSWMFWQDQEIDKNRFNLVKKVSNKEELEIFLKTFNACYQKNDPQNVYGELGDYLIVARDVWHRYHESNKLEYFMAYRDDKPVAVSTLTNYNGLGYISNVGSLKEVRGEGFGKLATLFCIDQSITNGNEAHCLATEEGTYANEFYKRIGFKTRFTAVAYTFNN